MPTHIAIPATARPNLPLVALNGEEASESIEPAQNPPELLQQGKNFYQNGQFAQAASAWEQAAQTYGARQQIEWQAQALNHLSLAYQHLGELTRARDAIATSLELIGSLSKIDPINDALLAQALNTRGRLELTSGQTEEALESWKQAQAAYDRASDETGILGSQLGQAQALQALGQYRQARSLLEQINDRLQSQPDSLLKANGLRSLGIALQTIGDPVYSKQVLEQSWAISDRLDAPAETGATLLSIGNIAKDFRQYDVALRYYQQAISLSPETLIQVQAQLNQLRIWVELCQSSQSLCSREEIPALAGDIQSRLMNLAPGRGAIYARVNFANSSIDLQNAGAIAIEPQEIASSLARAISEAQQLGDRRAEAYAQAYLGKLYARNGQIEIARTLTEQALQISQNIEAADITARAAGQLGGILKEQGNIPGAKAAYQSAFDILQTLRGDLVTINPDVQFEFKESIEPIYRELASLLLRPGATQEDLKQAREVMEALQLAQLDNFFGDSCLETQPVGIDAIDPEAAVIYPIILSDRLETVWSLPDGTFSHHATPLTAPEVEGILQQLYSSLYPVYPRDERLRLSEQVYDWLIRPAEADFERNGIKTLVFVPDGFLRNLPISVLYDGRQYVMEKYGVALSPGLQLFPEGLGQERRKALAVGLTEARQGFNPLPGVNAEMQEIASEVDSTQILLDGEFTSDRFETILASQSFPIVHMATHGQFSSNPEETFLLTWNDRIGVQDFNRIFENSRFGISDPIELLVMSACQTAAGDNRATLGLAGFALRSGARSTLASLWSVSDVATSDLMREFYNQLTASDRSVTKAEALRQAQLTLLRDPLHEHPYFWSAFVLVGNWL
ncbi:CHAT domain-containing protein [Oscillatoriales cyanobacterium LEGE 11467]|uniref:CHAT domain-containing protein n=1 Tax=Zarconia navalis LEGE 11467 TaxID=1828826 RepID=A0A928W1Y9_9CYAN|nr:CHAT domain-containing protein [Zarconia navalis LEGE 11467]